jgi:hypothetical protein
MYVSAGFAKVIDNHLNSLGIPISDEFLMTPQYPPC